MAVGRLSCLNMEPSSKSIMHSVTIITLPWALSEARRQEEQQAQGRSRKLRLRILFLAVLPFGENRKEDSQQQTIQSVY